VLDLPIVQAATFSDDEARSRVGAVIVIAPTARIVLANADPIGQTLVIAPTDPRLSLSREVSHRARDRRDPATPFPAGSGRVRRSNGLLSGPLDRRSTRLLVRVGNRRCDGRGVVERAIVAADSSAVQEMHTLETSRAPGISVPRDVLGGIALGAIALLLTLTGVYAVLAYVVAHGGKSLACVSRSARAARRSWRWCFGESVRLCVRGSVVGDGARRRRVGLLIRRSGACSRRSMCWATYLAPATVLTACLIAAYVRLVALLQ